MNDATKITVGSTTKDNNYIKQQKITRVKATVEYHIYHNGKIKYRLIDETGNGTEKTQETLKNARTKAKYIYHDTAHNEHEIGTYDIVVTDNTYSDYKDKLGGNKVYLINVSANISEYSKDDIKFKLTINTVRPYANDVATASLLGAMLNTGYTDFTFNGGSNDKGESPAPSKSHKNGTNLDLRYLRKDKSGGVVHLNKNDEKGDPCGWKGLDVERQNKFIDALILFGWGSVKAWKYWDSTTSPSTGKAWDEWYTEWKKEHPDETEKPILKNIGHLKNHHHHIHLQSYNPTLELMAD
ncbi:hypothetical protein [Intestinirhabdus alba]|jgi:hypothetical protein|uniref:Uncharacterized protein n=1 Tax=Intestinirhabdus alba TaxID=2899544 RepID=A0A6L6ILI9_9ENTR|nr:hypothetical protein [Intestinirhabdus alba]MTH46814.1 hypothetical protein [Intestinirhabdus alba]